MKQSAHDFCFFHKKGAFIEKGGAILSPTLFSLFLRIAGAC
jgi:hypothetical protein